MKYLRKVLIAVPVICLALVVYLLLSVGFGIIYIFPQAFLIASVASGVLYLTLMHVANDRMRLMSRSLISFSLGFMAVPVILLYLDYPRPGEFYEFNGKLLIENGAMTLAAWNNFFLDAAIATCFGAFAGWLFGAI
ncbi:hypothetical protein ACFQPC_14670 [Herminiimonas glaciei]|uniref:Uncharacterized protein n=1 Tax=Herminiimonas glaciei TaxID=523788 RepID=A0ABW2IDX0_9BURK